MDVFNRSEIDSFKKRIAQLSSKSEPQWGKMTVYQMLKHCTENEKMLLTEKTFKRLFIGKLFGKLALKGNIKNNDPLKRNSPTHPDLVIKGSGDVEAEKKVWLDLLDKYPTKTSSTYGHFVHPFFGKMDKRQVSIFAHKHIDHHLRQFGV